MKKTSVTGLIVTAGLSSRMGKFKPLLLYDGKSFLHNIVDKLDTICDEIIVVTGHNRDLIEEELNSLPKRAKIKPIFNEYYTDGMFTSLQKGIEQISSTNWVLYHFIDQPTLPNIFYTDLLAQIDDSFDWIQPKQRSKNGHPILLNQKTINLIIEAPQSCNLKNITNSSTIRKKYWNCNYSEIHDDIDTIERYNKIAK